MAISNIQTNVSALLNKAYNTEAQTSSANGTALAAPDDSPSAAGQQPPASASAQVTLSGAGNLPQTYTAQGLMQQLRQFQLSNASLLFGEGDTADDNSLGLTGLMSTDAASDPSAITEDLANNVNPASIDSGG
ncbi:hypothetical protein [Methylophilus medardicus]|uniref:Uncharacterized protein n=1 Tax=Methylophilus medardicus TaxID=2588534 RepID=A0A5B8CTP2_9PROT|nr:hypothetical protein [Methylophilus medardicus]QDC44275.1 hypothetical protein FIU01_06895 [Methylophilus medardicus]QDC49282.1 hypothetical protein FIU00_06895 [Methylophilus medardicus]QDC52987.1 hypothetical protein FIT99_06895 [Methylophilus medardicus]